MRDNIGKYGSSEPVQSGYQQPMEEDHAVIVRILGGSVQDFEILVRKYQVPVYNLLLRMLKNRYDAEEFTQAVFVKAYEALPSFRFEFRFFSWLYRIAVNKALNHLKNRKKFSGTDVSHYSGHEMKDGIRDKKDHIHMAIGLLKEKYKTLIILKYYEQLSYQEIAYIVGTEEKKVRSRLYEARLQLKEILEKTGYY